jgi:acyl carrier protein
MITGNEVEATIFAALAALNTERVPGDQIKISSKTLLFGAGAQLDSLQLVSLITDVEVALNTEHGLEISLADDRALERAESPYTSVATLRDYVLELAREA